MYHVTSLYWQLIAQGYAKLDCINLSSPGHGLDATNTRGAVRRLQRSKQGRHDKQMTGQAGPLVWAVSDSVDSIMANSCYCSFVFHCVLSVCSFPYSSLCCTVSRNPQVLRLWNNEAFSTPNSLFASFQFLSFAFQQKPLKGQKAAGQGEPPKRSQDTQTEHNRQFKNLYLSKSEAQLEDVYIFFVADADICSRYMRFKHILSFWLIISS